jgi:hypothetical protein
VLWSPCTHTCFTFGNEFINGELVWSVDTPVGGIPFAKTFLDLGSEAQTNLLTPQVNKGSMEWVA